MNIKSLPRNHKLSLTNSGGLSVFFLGVGSAFTKNHYQNNILIIKGNYHVLIDCGTKTPQALHELGLSVMDIENLIITHSHADHIGGLEELMLMDRYVKHRKPTIHITPEYQQILWDMSLQGGSALNEEKDNEPLSFEDYFNIVRPNEMTQLPRQTTETDIGTINIKMYRTKHIPDTSDSWHDSFWSVGLIIDDRVMFTSDTRFDKELVTDYASMFDLDVIFHDCQFYNGGVHAAFDELSSLPDELKKKIILMHYGDNWKDFKKKVNQNNFAGLAKQWKLYNF